MTRDFVAAARALRREPGFVAIVVLTFALAIAANAAMFGLVNRLMLHAARHRRRRPRRAGAIVAERKKAASRSP